MTCVFVVQPHDQQRNAALIRRFCDIMLLAVASSKRKDCVAKHETVFDFLRYSKCELVGRICAVKPAAEVFGEVVHQHSLSMSQGDRLGRVNRASLLDGCMCLSVWVIVLQ